MRSQFFKRLIFLIFWFPASSIAQETFSVNANFQNQPLTEVLAFFEKNYPVTFSFDTELAAQSIISIKFDEESLADALARLLQNTPFAYEISDKTHVLLYPKEKADAPELTFCGTIRDTENGTPLPFAYLILESNIAAIECDEQGNFEFKAVAKPAAKIEIRYIGYQAKTLALTAFQDKKCQDIFLSLVPFDVEPITIKDKAIQILSSANEGNGYRLEPQRLTTLPGWGEPDVFRMLQLLPGIEASNELAAALHIRGGTPDQNLILWDGIPIYHSGHLFGIYSVFNPYAVSELKVYRSGFGARYGGRISGLVDISGHPASMDSISAGFGFNLVNAHAFVKTPVGKKSALLVAGRRAFSDIVQSPTFERLFKQVTIESKIGEDNSNQSITSNPGFVFTDLNLKWAWQFNRKQKASVSLFRGADKLNYRVEEQADFPINYSDNLEVFNNGISANWQGIWNEKFNTEMNLAYSDYRHNYDFSLVAGTHSITEKTILQKNRMQELNFSLIQNLAFSKNQAFHLGYQMARHDVFYNLNEFQAPQNQFFQRHAVQGLVHSFFVDTDFKMPEKWSLDAGIRYNYFTEKSNHYWAPRLSFSYRPFGKHFFLKGSAGRHFQFVSQLVKNNQLGIGEQIWVLASDNHQIAGDQWFPVLKSNKITTGLQFAKNRLLIEIEAYRQWVDGVSSLTIDFEEPGFSQPDYRHFKFGQANMKGIDVLVKQKWKPYQFWLSYSLSKATYEFPHFSNGREFVAGHDRRHSFKWTHIFKFRRWDTSLSWQIHSGIPYTNGFKEERTDPAPDQTPWRIHYYHFNTARLPVYHRLDWAATYQFTQPKKRFKGKAGVAIFNLYNRRNLSDIDLVLQYKDNQQEPDLLQLERPLLGFTPNLFLELKW